MVTRYSQEPAVRVLAGNPKLANVSVTSIEDDINSTDSFIDNETGRSKLNPWTSNDPQWELIQDISEHYAAANTIERFNTYGNIELSYAKAKFLRDRADVWLASVMKSLPSSAAVPEEQDIQINVSHYETQDARTHDGETTVTTYRSTEDLLGAAPSNFGLDTETDLTKKIAEKNDIANMTASLDADIVY